MLYFVPTGETPSTPKSVSPKSVGIGSLGLHLGGVQARKDKNLAKMILFFFKKRS